MQRHGAVETEMPLGWAAMNESIRFATTALFTMPHNAMAELAVDGYTFPKDTEFVANVWRMHMNPKVSFCFIGGLMTKMRLDCWRSSRSRNRSSRPGSWTSLRRSPSSWPSPPADVDASARVSPSRRSFASFRTSFRTIALSWTRGSTTK